jgi:hypothetical protein
MELSHKSRFITYLALFSIVAAVYTIIQDVSNMVMLNSLNSSPEYRMAEKLMPSLSVSPSGTIVEIILQAAGIVASIGMFNRLNWGRVMYIIVLSAVTVWGIITSMTSYLSFSQYLNAYGIGGSLSLMIIGNSLVLGITVYLVWKLSTSTIRDEFVKK